MKLDDLNKKLSNELNRKIFGGMTEVDKELMLKLLAPGDEVVLLSQTLKKTSFEFAAMIRAMPSSDGDDGISRTVKIGGGDIPKNDPGIGWIKVKDADRNMVVKKGEIEISIPYACLSCEAIRIAELLLKDKKPDFSGGIAKERGKRNEYRKDIEAFYK